MEQGERVRLHPYYSERVLRRVQSLTTAAALGGMHHERLDGSGYYRGSARAKLSPAAWVLALADAYQAMIQPRPYRPSMQSEEAAHELQRMASAGRFEQQAVGCQPKLG